MGGIPKHRRSPESGLRILSSPVWTDDDIPQLACNRGAPRPIAVEKPRASWGKTLVNGESRDRSERLMTANLTRLGPRRDRRVAPHGAPNPTSSTRLAQGARAERVVGVGVGGMVMVVPSTRNAVVPVLVGMIVPVLVAMGMVPHR